MQRPHAVLLAVPLLSVPGVMVVHGKDMVMVLSCHGVGVLVGMVHGGAHRDTAHRQLL